MYVKTTEISELNEFISERSDRAECTVYDSADMRVTDITFDRESTGRIAIAIRHIGKVFGTALLVSKSNITLINGKGTVCMKFSVIDAGN